jgi:hypothetical protein
MTDPAPPQLDMPGAELDEHHLFEIMEDIFDEDFKTRDPLKPSTIHFLQTSVPDLKERNYTEEEIKYVMRRLAFCRFYGYGKGVIPPEFGLGPRLSLLFHTIEGLVGSHNTR